MPEGIQIEDPTQTSMPCLESQLAELLLLPHNLSIKDKMAGPKVSFIIMEICYVVVFASDTMELPNVDYFGDSDFRNNCTGCVNRLHSIY